MAPQQQQIKLGKGSPVRREMPGKMSTKLASRPTYNLYCWGWPSSPWEAYTFRKGDKDAYAAFYRQVVDGEKDCQELEDMGFRMYFTRRRAPGDNSPSTGEDNWPENVYVRCVNNMNPTTPQTRQEGLSFLRRFFMNKEYSKYPPNDINTVDMTNEQDLMPMDHLLMDQHVMALLDRTIPTDHANRRFFTNHRAFASLFFGGPVYPPEAITTYGYGTTLPPPDAANSALDGAVEEEEGKEGKEGKEEIPEVDEAPGDEDQSRPDPDEAYTAAGSPESKPRSLRSRRG